MTTATLPTSPGPIRTIEQGAEPSRRRRRRVLVSAYAVSPVRGSEPGVGWNVCLRLARYHDVTVLCSPVVPPRDQLFRDEIAQWLRDHGPVPGLSFHFVEPPLPSYVFQRETLLARRTLYYAGYRAWQKAAYRAATRLHAERPFDLVHHLNITGFREPGYLWRLPIPFVWGPISGAADVPAAFLPLMGRSERWFYRLRNASNAIQKRTTRRCRLAARKASHLWTIGDADRRLVQERWGRNAEPMIETGTTPIPNAAPKRYDPARPLRLVWSGQHIGRKALAILLHAIAGQRVELTVLGNGPETPRWKALAHQLNLGASVRWAGHLPHDRAIAQVAAADVFVLTSVQEGAPHVVLEALSLGLPVVCHDACGMGAAVTPACGIKVPMRDPAASVTGFGDAIERFIAEPSLLARLSEGALRRAEELSWDEMARRIAATYDSVVAAQLPVAAGGRP
jgi:glycosyltransferase involved in cell wall biosynthesis